MNDLGYAQSIEMHSQLTKKQLVKLCVVRLKTINDLKHELRNLKKGDKTVQRSNESQEP